MDIEGISFGRSGAFACVFIIIWIREWVNELKTRYSTQCASLFLPHSRSTPTMKHTIHINIVIRLRFFIFFCFNSFFSVCEFVFISFFFKFLFTFVCLFELANRTHDEQNTISEQLACNACILYIKCMAWHGTARLNSARLSMNAIHKTWSCVFIFILLHESSCSRIESFSLVLLLLFRYFSILTCVILYIYIFISFCCVYIFILVQLVVIPFLLFSLNEFRLIISSWVHL